MRSLDQVNWGIIGCGDVCEVKSGPAFNKVENSKLVAVMRRDAEKAKDYAVRNNVPKYYDDARQLIADSEVSAIYIATPPAFHEAYAIEALNAGKPIYIEKPVTLNSSSCERIIKAVRETKVSATVAHYRRALPNFKKIKALIEDNVIGDVRLIKISTLQVPNSKIISQSGNWRLDPSLSGGGLFHDLSPHQLDIIYWIFGKPGKTTGHSINQSKQYGATDLTSLTAEFNNGVFLNGIWAFNVGQAAEEETCEIIGSKGKIKFAFFKDPSVDLTIDNNTERLKFEYPQHIQQPMIAEVVAFFRGQKSNPCSVDDALVTMEMMDSTINV